MDEKKTEKFEFQITLVTQFDKHCEFPNALKCISCLKFLCCFWNFVCLFFAATPFCDHFRSFGLEYLMQFSLSSSSKYANFLVAFQLPLFLECLTIKKKAKSKKVFIMQAKLHVPRPFSNCQSVCQSVIETISHRRRSHRQPVWAKYINHEVSEM